MRKKFCLILCLFSFISVSFAQEKYPVSKDTFKETDLIWAETVRFSQSLSDVIKDSMFEEQKEEVILLQKDISGINLSFLTLITMLDIEYLHSAQGQENQEVIEYISRYTESFYDIVEIAQKKNEKVISDTEDMVVSKLYTKANGYLNAARRILPRLYDELKVFLPSKEEEITDRTESGPGSEDNQAVQEETSENIIPEGSWSITRYNPKTGYISYYTRDGRFVGRKKKK